jgi:predicted DNA-binding transcriptional regulator YafY
MRASRLLTILILLQVRGRMSAEVLARELEVSVRTIYRDVDQLGAAGVPVFAERGRRGGFALLSGFRTNLTGLTATEADAVTLIGSAQAAADLGLGTEAESARLKILASLPQGKGKIANRVATRFHLDPAPWYSRHAPPAALRTLAEAVWSDHQVQLTYESWKGVARRVISPLGLVMKAGAWYLAGASGGSTRIYKVAAINALAILAEPVQRPRGFDLAKFWDDATREFEKNLRSETARVRLSPRGVRLLRDISPSAADAVSEQHPSPPADSWIEARIPVEKQSMALREAMRMGSEMEILEPRALRAAVAAEARRIAKLHAPRRGIRPRPGSRARPAP